MKQFVFFVAMSVFIAVPAEVFSQVVDVRAFSRQRGFKAYQSKQTHQRQQRISLPRKSIAASQEIENKNETTKNVPVRNDKGDNENQTKEMQEYIENNPHVKPDIGM